MAEESLRPEYFVTRPDGRMIPLIAVDQLQDYIDIEGAHRVMSPLEIVGMTNVGRSRHRPERHEVLEAAQLKPGNRVAGRPVLKARYFLTRDTGNMVPLVAMDEMPEYFVIIGVPREVSSYEIAGMTCAGISPVRERLHFVVDRSMVSFSDVADAQKLDGEVDEYVGTSNTSNPHVLEEPSKTEGSTTPYCVPITHIPIWTPPTPTSEAETEIPFTANVSSNETSEIPEMSQTTPSHASNLLPNHVQLVPGRKTLCSYWIRRGECDYSQQGCMYLHEMPRTREDLNAVGLRDIPKWYREKHRLGSFLAAGGSGAGFGDEDQRSAAALGAQDDEKEAKLPDYLTSNWRAVPREQNVASTSTNNRRGGNIYNPRASRAITPRSDSSNTFSNRTPSPMISGPLRSNETMQSRQQLNMIHQMDVHARAERYRRENAANRRGAVGGIGESRGPVARGVREASHSRRMSSSTMASDIEAAALRQDAERRAREDADYAKATEATMGVVSGQAAQGATAPVGANIDQSGAGRGGVGRTGRGGKAKRGRGSGRLSAGNSRGAA